MNEQETKAVLVRNGRAIAFTYTNLKSGAYVDYAYSRCEERINANRDWNLVNSKEAKISRAKKYLNVTHYLDYAKQIIENDTDNEFYINIPDEDYDY